MKARPLIVGVTLELTPDEARDLLAYVQADSDARLGDVRKECPSVYDIGPELASALRGCSA